MSTLYLHLGYPKTGTTTLQRRVFDALHREGTIRYLGMFGFEADRSPDRQNFFRAVQQSLYLEDDAAFEAMCPELQAAYRELTADVPAGVPVLMSNEHFVQSQWSTTRRGERILPRRSAARLARIFADEDVRLMVAVRRQDAEMRSMFLEHRSRPQHAHGDHVTTVEDYVARCTAETGIEADFYDYAATIDAYRQAFGDVPVLAWTFERFRDAQQDVVERIIAFLGLGEEIPACVPMPLESLNAKSASNGDATLPEWSRLHRLVVALPGGNRLAGLVRHVPLAGRLSDALKGKVAIRPLTEDERAGVLSRFEHSNRELATELPALAEAMHAAGYFERAMALGDQ